MVSSSRSIRGRSAMTTHVLSQVLQRPELELLDGAFRAVERGRHLANALLLDEPHPDHLLLQIRQLLDLLIQRESTVDVLELPRVGRLGRWLLRVAGAFTPMVGQGVRGD